LVAYDDDPHDYPGDRQNKQSNHIFYDGLHLFRRQLLSVCHQEITLWITDKKVADFLTKKRF
jgi:hypothetical protein